MIAEARTRESWRQPGCDYRCRLVTAIQPGLLARVQITVHDPSAHETWGRHQCERLHEPGAIVETGRLLVDRRTPDVIVDGHPVGLSATETRLLLALAARVGCTASHRTLIEDAWGAEYLEAGRWANNHLLRVTIRRLRERLMTAAELITTVTGFGYRLERVAPGQRPTPPPKVLPSAPVAGWSSTVDCCTCCGTTRYQHHGYGRCRHCFSYSGGPRRRRAHYGPCGAPPLAQEEDA